ncbi:MAG TPA: ribonuclease P protein component [Chloroflexota bacterium]|jgi:ribonuclease P protein component|nr:ribonuclease P protein component [Chloroflexota bacterium]
MKRAQRLRKAADFERVRAQRRSWAHPLLVLYAAENGLRMSRIGVIVGRQVGKAVVRNRVKRRIREAVRLRYPALVEGMDLVWIARPASATADYAQIAAAVEQLLRRARLLRPATAPAQAPPPSEGP